MNEEELNLLESEMQKSWENCIKPFMQYIPTDKYVSAKWSEKKGEAQLCIRDIPAQRVSTIHFYVDFGDGTRFPAENEKHVKAIEILIYIIKKVGPDAVERMNIRTSGGYNLLLTSPFPSKGTKPIGNYHVISQTPTSEKIMQIRFILDKLLPNAKIEFYED